MRGIVVRAAAFLGFGRWMMRVCLLIMLSVHTGVWGRDAGAQSSFPIQEEAVKAVLQEAYPEWAGASVALPGAPVAEVRRPVLVPVQAVEDRAFDSAYQIRFACRDRACLPFYVEVRLPRTDGSRDEGAAHALGVVQGAERARKKMGAAGDMAAVRVGDRAELRIDSGKLHLLLSVVCLQAGRVGDTIRVSGTTRSAINFGRILDAGHLQGSL